jgi:hypothetical protein
MMTEIQGSGVAAAGCAPAGLCAGPEERLRFVFRDEGAGEGRVERLDSAGRTAETADLAGIRDAIPCFTPESRIATARGERAAGAIRPGDRVVTRDNGEQTVLWAGTARFGWRDLGANPFLRPVRVRAGSLGAGLPVNDLVVSPNHRFLVTVRDGAETRDEAVAPAFALAGRPGIERIAPLRADYVQILFARHEAVLSEGVWTESFRASPDALAALEPEARAAIAGVLGAAAPAPARVRPEAGARPVESLTV